MPGAEAPDILLGLDPLWLSTGIFLATYALLISERVHRTVAAMLGAGMMILSGIITQDDAFDGVDFNTISLLTGMMILVGITQRTGIFQFVAVWVVKKARASPKGILLLLATVTAVFSAFFDNVTTVLLIVPVTLLIVEKLGVSPYPFLFAEIFASNIGGTATLIGDPPNIMIGSAVGLTFTDFITELGPIIVVIHLAVLAVLYLFWGSQLTSSAQARASVMAFDARSSITDTRLLRQSLAVMALVIAGFIAGEHFELQSGSVALGGAALLMLLYTIGRGGREQTARVQEVLAELEWSTILFFMCLFMMVHGLKASGVLNLLGQQLLEMTGGDLPATTFLTLWLAAIASAVIDNVPFVATMIPVLQSTAPELGGAGATEPVWWALSLGACLGGNGTLVGATANIIVAGFAERAGYPISFSRFLLMGVPVTLLSVTIAGGYLYLRHFS
ncbi:MAG: ArsB/NhaD family transporter [Gammaproteobacteria bacterium]|jgi:Na+/H+ antiporter NhaD/arsenite permease-like protein|nr:ArsB/NhaD family transporter [Gammaproteobacteria bacterium]MDH5171408.1 ArsB/NhaD family transporter [Gammaproteobacteria bacterium]